MTSRRLTNATGRISEAALALRRRYTPSAITAMFPVDLQICVISACPTIDLCSEIQSPTLGVLSEAYSGMPAKDGTVVENAALTWMKAQMIAVSVFANVREKMSDWQINAVCEQILCEQPQTTMMEFVLFCARLRSGAYEDFYGSVDPMRIIKSFNAFLNDKRRDLARKWERDEEERRTREDEESRRNAISYEEWRRKLKEKGEEPVFDMFKDADKKKRTAKKKGGNQKDIWENLP